MVVYIMVLETSRIRQTSPIADKLLTLYGEGGPNIGPSQTLVLDTTVRYKVLVKTLTPDDVQMGLTNRNVVDQHLERSINFTNEK